MSRLISPIRAALAVVLFCSVAVYPFPSTRSDKVVADVIINEVDSDTPGTDILEFVELYDGGAGNTTLDGYVVVFFNGGAVNDASYAAFDLDGFTTNAAGYFTLGNAAVSGVDMETKAHRSKR